MEKDKKVLRIKSANPLEKAYKALEAEFTKRCQALAILREENESLKRTVSDLTSKIEGNVCPDYEQIMADERFLSEYALKCERLRTMIIKDYLKSLSSHNAVSVLRGGVGESALTPVNKPKSLAEAKKLAEIIING